MAKASGRREEPAPPAHVFHFPVDEFILHQTPHLSVQHPVKLGAQDNKIAEMAVHGKKTSSSGHGLLRSIHGR